MRRSPRAVRTEGAPRQGHRGASRLVPGPRAPPPERTPTARERFRTLDPYRVAREWARYEGTAQRRLFRQLRVRFLVRHAVPGGWALDVGSGPGRFAPFLGDRSTHRILLDLSLGMLRAARARSTRRDAGTGAEYVRGDALRPPFVPRRFQEVVALGNPLGFSGTEAGLFLDRVADLLAPGGVLLLETMSGPGESSRYLRRLPSGTVRRVLRAPNALLEPRVLREGFLEEDDRLPERRGFRRMGPAEIGERLRRSGIVVHDVLAVASALGADPDRLEGVAADPRAWGRLLELEESVGRRPERWTRSAAVLLAASRARDTDGTPALGTIK